MARAVRDGTWAMAAQRNIAAILDRLPPDISAATKREALMAAYPFGERKHFPYRVWCREVRRIVGAKVAQNRGNILSAPRRGVPAEYRSHLEMIAVDPCGTDARLVFADLLEEREDERAVILRSPPGLTIQQARDMYKKLTGIWPEKNINLMLCDVMDGTPRLLMDPDCVRAVEAARNKAILEFFRGETPKEAADDAGPD